MPTLAELWVNQGEAAVLLGQIDRKFGPSDQTVPQRNDEADPETILEWCDRILSADSLKAVLH